MSGVIDIFLSYSREDQVVARRFAEAFEREGMVVWWDATLRSGEAYDQVTEKALREAKAVVVLWSTKSVDSRWVRAEATLADRNRTLVPAMIEACERPIMFELTQTADLSHWSGNATDRTWLAFLADVRRFVAAGGAVRAAAATARPASAVPALTTRRDERDDRPSLAFLPFTNRSGEQADDVFADGMVEDLVSALSLNDGVRVIAQSATSVYRKNVSDLRTIGRELDVRYLLEGNVRRVGTTMRVTAQLVEAENGAILWSQKFDRPLAELAELQEQLVLDVAAHLGVQVERVEMEKALKKPGDLTAWEAVMRALASFGQYAGPGGGVEALESARRAIAIAPDYALCHAVLAETLAHHFMSTGGKDPLMAQEGLRHAERAIVLAPSDARVAALSAIAMCYFGRWQEGFQHARRAVDLNPNLSIPQAALGMLSIRAQRPDDAVRIFEAVERMAPRGAVAFMAVGLRGLAHFQAGRYLQALEAAERAYLLNPGFLFALKDQVVYCERLGRHDAALEALRRLRRANPALKLEDFEAANRVSFLPPETAAALNATLREVWMQTPMESA